MRSLFQLVPLICAFSTALAVPVNLNFTYDAANRLTAASSVSYDLDLAGNISRISGSVTPVLQLPLTANVAAGAQSGLTLALTANVSWTASSDQAWLTLASPTSGTGSATLTYSVTANTGAARPAHIQVTQQGGGLTATCTVTQAAGVAAPEIIVEQPLGSEIPNNGSLAFSSVTVGLSTSLTFTIRNTGPGNLTGLAITKDGANVSDFSVGSPGKTTLITNETTTFTVTFSPGATGSRSAAIHIASNDGDENPYHVALSGTGTTSGGGSPGALDITFGSGGKVTFSRSSEDSVSSMALESDGRVLVGGSTWGTSNSDFALIRCLADGAPDSAFGSGGWVNTDFGGQDSGASVAVQSDDRILLAGTAYDSVWTSGNFALARYLTNGSLDTTFGSGGKVVTSVGSGNSFGTAIALQSDGRILVAGGAYNGVNYDFALVRYLANGALDSNFGTGGKVLTAIGSDTDSGEAVAVQRNGKIVVAGRSRIGSYYEFSVACFNSDGSLDGTFGNGGKVTTSIGSTDDFGQSLALQSDGRILVSGIAKNGSAAGVGLARYQTNGTLDNSFGTGGVVYTPKGQYLGEECHLAIQNDGCIVVTSHRDGDVLLARYKPNGTLDPGFGSGGLVTTPVGTANDYGRSVAVQSDSRILVASEALPYSAGPTLIALLRYEGGASIEPDIAVEQPAGTGIANGGSRDFGSVTVGGNASLTFTIRNTGPASLTGLAIMKDDANASDFTVGSLGKTTLTTSDSTAFTVTFAPSSAGVRVAAIHIASNDADENPFDVNLTGTGVAGSSKAEMTTPVPNSTLSSTSATFMWNSGSGASAYWLYVGSLPGGKSYHDSGQLASSARSRTVSGLPLDGRTVYVRLYSKLGSAWVYNDYTYTAVTGTKAVMTNPAAGTALTSGSGTFTWNGGNGASGYWLYVGSSVGASNYFNSGGLASTILTRSVTGLPSNGSPVFVRLWSQLGGAWVYNDYTYSAFTASGALISSPFPGSTLGAASATFTWNAASGAGGYWLYVGSSPGAKNYHDSGQLASTVQTRPVTSLPTSGGPVYARLWTKFGNTWLSTDAVYTAYTDPNAPSKAVMANPANGAPLAATTQVFSWNAGNTATGYWLYAGSSVGAKNYFDSGSLASNVLSRTITGLPANGSTVYVCLYTKLGSTWSFNNYTYTAFSGKAVMTSPASGTTLTSSTATFAWTSGTGAMAYWLYVGNSLGASNFHNSGSLGTSILSRTVSGLPNNGSTIYVRLYTKQGTTWLFNDSTYHAATH